MNPLGLISIIVVLVVVGLLVWEFYVCEGAHLGPRVVIGLYDLAATRYDRIKQFDPDWERRFVGEPIAAAVEQLVGARLLDAGAGTGRVARSLLPLLETRLQLVCLEPSRKMLALGRRQAPGGLWLRGRADPLPFADDTFDIVVSLEMIEFTPDPEGTLRELVRVLRPGGSLLVTNRVGREAPLMLGRTFRRASFPQRLNALGLDDVILYPWQVEYDLAWAVKV
jgi:ubiquinone/menaquinone biosynthesis C-methylase UbiE